MRTYCCEECKKESFSAAEMIICPYCGGFLRTEPPLNAEDIRGAASKAEMEIKTSGLIWRLARLHAFRALSKPRRTR